MSDYGSIGASFEKQRTNDDISRQQESRYHGFRDETCIVDAVDLKVYVGEPQLISNSRLSFSKIFVVVLIVASIFLGIATWQQSASVIPILLDSGSLEDYESLSQSTVVGSAASLAEIVADAEDIYLSTSNEYGQLNIRYPWIGKDAKGILFEPYKITTIVANGIEAAEGISFRWCFKEIGGETISTIDTELPKLEMTLTSDVNRILDLEVVDSASASILLTISYKVFTKYVKRELRSLSAADKEKFLDTAALLWKYSTDDGRAKYGHMFTGVDTYVAEHALASNDIMCDQFHDGAGFFTHHMALQASFDAALKAIDPSVVLPYWDFTIEGQAIEDAHQSPDFFLEVSPLLSGEWFGESDKQNHIVNSRWAHSKFPTTLKDKSSLQSNSYGMLRSYWNNNNDLQITRHSFDTCGIVSRNKPIPTCASHYAILSSNSLAEFLLLSPAKGHGPMHVNLGGVSGPCVEAFKNFKERWSSVLLREYSDEEIVALDYDIDNISNIRSMNSQYPVLGILDFGVVGEYFHIYRALWRSHMCARDDTLQLLHCPKKCDSDTSIAECSCSVPALESNETDWQNVFECLFADDSTMKDLFTSFMPEPMLEDLTYTVARAGVIEGDLLESASPADPLFWLIHPVLNRLEHAKRLSTITNMAGMEFEKWNKSHVTWNDYSYYTFGAGENAAFPNGYVCTGHAADDQVLPRSLPLERGFSKRVDLNNDGVISNWEFFAGTDPNSPDDVDYVFDNFDWSHCEDK